ncbi:MAG TPA: aminotransferase class V-fold PLP-dependent enzyme [Eubacteriaceae bacterium]|nr:aminotransferase class V-fold PLP-dependent enzyme [Eubacteriaceae bacterium]
MRSDHWFAEEVSQLIDGDTEAGIIGTRQSIAKLINAQSEQEIIFTQNTTHAINMVALGFNFKPGDVVLLTGREHNSNLVPWLRLQKEGLIKVIHTATDLKDTFDLDAYEQCFKSNKIRLVSIVYTSNVTGVTLPVKEMITIAHQYGARVLLDGAQAVPHQTVDVRALNADFLAFSMHKMCGPRGIGVLYAKSELIGRELGKEKTEYDFIESVIVGGGTVRNTTYNSYEPKIGIGGFEAGIQDYAGIIASGVAARYLQQIGIDRIAVHEELLNSYLSRKLLDRYGETGWFTIIGPEEASLRGGILTFVIQRPNAIGISKELSDKNNIMIRDGVFCVHSYFNQQFGSNWIRPRSPREQRMIYRISFYLYNTISECDIFLDTLDVIINERSYRLY